MRVLAAAAGLTVGKTEPDVTGDDYTFGYKGTLRGIRHPRIETQVKSWRQSSARHADGFWRYRMEPKHFNELAQDDFALPRFLVLVIVPDHWQEYTASAPSGLTVRHCAYWLSLADRARVPDDSAGKVPVDVPVEHILTTDKLLTLMESGVRTRVVS